MQILPVIDLKEGVVVRGVAGERDNYRPIASTLCSDAQGASVARGLIDRFGFRSAYVADLDAIGGAEPDWRAYQALLGCGLELWVDAGAGSSARATALAQFVAADRPLSRIIVGLESLADPRGLGELIEIITPDRLVFSLDLKQGRPLTSSPLWPRDPHAIADFVAERGVTQLIVLDLAAVGVGGGVPTLDLCSALRRRYPLLQLTTGGGVRHRADLAALAEEEIDYVLIASALHNGALGVEDVRPFTTLR